MAVGSVDARGDLAISAHREIQYVLLYSRCSGGFPEASMPLGGIYYRCLKGDACASVFVVVALPKRILVEEAAAHLRANLGPAAEIVGYAHSERQEHASASTTRVLFATAGWLLRKMNDPLWVEIEIEMR